MLASYFFVSIAAVSALLQTPTMVQGYDSVSCFVLASHSQYSASHIWIPDSEQPVAAIRVGDRFYSFFKIAKDGELALDLVTRLSQRGDLTVLTQAVQGFALWVLEPKASPTFTTQERSQIRGFLQEPAPCFLATQTSLQPLTIDVPDLDKPLDAIYLNGKYYSIFRVEFEAHKVLELAAKIAQRGDEVAIARIQKDYQKAYAVCIIEPETKRIYS